MKGKITKADVRAMVIAEARQDAEEEARVKERLRSWKRRTMMFGLALVVNIGAIMPFSDGYPLHRYAEPSGRLLVYLAMCLFSVTIFSAATSYNLWSYLGSLQRINKRFAPPGSKR
jgi:hypothetical protein